MKDKKEVLQDFLYKWKIQDYVGMHELCQETWKVANSVAVLKKLLPKKIKSFKIVDIEESTECVYDAKVYINGVNKAVGIRMICETEPFKPSKKGVWGVNPLSILRK